MSSNLVILYHREPYDEVIEDGRVRYVEKSKPNGIVPTLKSFLEASPGGRWIAWKQVEAADAHAFQSVVAVERGGQVHHVERIPLSAEQVSSFYHITSKEAFWPILHSFPWQFSYDSSDWANFQDINQRFAEAACAGAAPDAVFWIHDYNLWLTPQYIRERLPEARIVFFHHTPFPAADIFHVLPWREAIANSLLQCDLVGFHIPRYVQNFARSVRGLLGAEVVEEGPVAEGFVATGSALAEPTQVRELAYKGRRIRVDAFPLGTSPKHIEAICALPETQARIERIREETRGHRLIVSAGRIDYTKGVKESLLCYERLLDRRPDIHSKVNMVTIAVAPADGMKAYRDARHEIEQLVGSINGRFGRLNWRPIVFFTSGLPFAELVAYLRVADIGWVTPLRDGLNLVAKEFVIAQDDNPGVLVLSEFAGTAVELPDAVLTNPYASARLDAAMDEALAMPLAERAARMASMRTAIERMNVGKWASMMFGQGGLAPELAEAVQARL